MNKFLGYLASGLLLTSCASDPIPDPASEKKFWTNTLSSCTPTNRTLEKNSPAFKANLLKAFSEGSVVLLPRKRFDHPTQSRFLETVNGALLSAKGDTIAKLAYQEEVCAYDQSGQEGFVRESYYIYLPPGDHKNGSQWDFHTTTGRSAANGSRTESNCIIH